MLISIIPPTSYLNVCSKIILNFENGRVRLADYADSRAISLEFCHLSDIEISQSIYISKYLFLKSPPIIHMPPQFFKTHEYPGPHYLAFYTRRASIRCPNPCLIPLQLNNFFDGSCPMVTVNNQNHHTVSLRLS